MAAVPLARAACAIVTLVLVSPSWADESGAARAGASFGWEVAAVDASAIALGAVGGLLTSRTTGLAVLPALGGAAYFAGGPLVHVAHHDPRGAWGSLAWRILAPVALGGAAAGVAALATPDGPTDLCSSRTVCAAALVGAAGFGAGMMVAMVHDWATAREPAPARSAATASSGTPRVAWTPLVAAGPHGATLGLAALW